MNKMKSINLPADEAQTIMAKLSTEAEKLPSIGKKEKDDIPSKTEIRARATKSISFPDYVWEHIRSEAFREKMPMNVYILHALKSYGVKVHEEDLVDARTVR